MFLLTATSGTAASTPAGDTGAITTAHLILIAVLIVLTILGLLWGMKQKRARAAGERVEQERAEELRAHPQDSALVTPERDEHVHAAAPATQAPAHAAPDAAPPVPAPAPAPATEPREAPAATHKSDAAGGRSLIDVKGLGPKAVPLLAAQGITTLADLATLDPDRARAVDGNMGPLAGRMLRDRWVEQAQLLAAGDVAAFEATYGKLG